MSKILIVEDNADVRQLIKSYLRKQGHDFVEAADGHQGLQALLLQSDIELVLLDVMMPIYDGKYFLRNFVEFKKQREKLKVCMLTAIGLESAIKECLKLGADDYMVKPIDKMVLKEKVHFLINNSADNDFSSVKTESKGEILLKEKNINITIRSISEYSLIFDCHLELPIGAKIIVRSKILDKILKAETEVILRVIKSERDGRMFKSESIFIGLNEQYSQNLRIVTTRMEEIYES